MNMRKFPLKIKKFRVRPDEFVIFTLGDLNRVTLPSKKDLLQWKSVLIKAYPNIKHNHWLIVPPVLNKIQVFEKNKKHKVYLDNLEYLEYLSTKFSL